ncbi:MAG TPA: MFS transporter [Gaiellaceae bacterium]|nr:MFS transporter [Gaiellaceae bacterium]
MPGRTSRQLAPLRGAGFRLLFLSTLGSSVGTFLAAIALTIDVKDRTDSGLWVGAVLLVDFLPSIVVGLTLGPLLDRLRRRNLMVAADVLRAIVFCLLPFATNASEIVGLALVAGLATGFFRPAVYAGVPNMVSESELPAANALLQTVENVSWAAGPVLGGVLTAAEGPHLAYWINAVSFAVSAVLVLRIPARLLQSETMLSRGHWRDLRDGFSAVLHSRSLLAVLVAWTIALAGSGATSVAEVFMAKNTLHAGDFGYGLLYGAIGVGLVIGSWVSGALVERIGIARAYGCSIALMAATFGIGAASVDIWMAAGCCLVGGIGNGAAVVCNALLVQRTRDDLRGRALTFVMSATWAGMGLGIVAAGAAMAPGDARWVWGAGAGALAVASVVGWALAREPRASVTAAEAGA